MKVHDYNGSGHWSREGVQRRYDELSRRFHVANPFDLRPNEHVTSVGHWIYPIMTRVIDGIESGDPACIEIGVEFIEEDQNFPFGATLKSNTARALRRASLTEYQRERIRKRVMTMLVAGHVPREYRQYARLARKIGLGPWWSAVAGRVNLENPHVRRYFEYFQRHVVS